MLRPAGAGDAAAVAAVLQASRAQAMPWLPVVHDVDDVLAWVTTVLLPTRRVVVAEQQGAVVGACALDGSELEQLYVAPHAQGAGLGRALLDDAEDASAGRLRLWTSTRNARARRSYAAAGFREVFETDGADDEDREPDVRLEWGAGHVTGTLLG